MSFSWDAIQVVFCDPNSFRGGIRQRHQHFAAGLAAAGLGVLYIEEPGNWLSVGRSPEKPSSNRSAWKSGPRQEAPNLWVWTPPPGMPTGYWDRGINLRNHASYLKALISVTGPLPSDGIPVMVACNPLASGWLPLLPTQRRIYDCCDDYSLFPVPSKRPQVALAMEQELFAAAAVTIFSSETLLRRKLSSTMRPPKRVAGSRQKSPTTTPGKIVLLRNGSEAERFAVDRATTPVPADLKPLLAKGPVLLFFGALAAWFDEALIAEVARRHPDWQFALIGPVTRKFPALQALPNCHFLGKKPYDALPGYVAHSQVGLLPYQLTPLIEAVDPVKVYEYLAGGLGVMSTPLPELKVFRGFVKKGSTAAEWEAGITALLEVPEDARPARQRFAQQHTWEVRVQWLKRVLLGREKRLVDESKEAVWAEDERALEALKAANAPPAEAVSQETT